MKERELRLYANCSMCHKPVGHTHLPLFWRVTVERFGIKADVVRRQQGLTDFLGGSNAAARIAMAMGPDEEMTQPMMDPVTLSFCESCCMSPILLAAIAEWPSVLPAADANNGLPEPSNFPPMPDVPPPKSAES